MCLSAISPMSSGTSARPNFQRIAIVSHTPAAIATALAIDRGCSAITVQANARTSAACSNAPLISCRLRGS